MNLIEFFFFLEFPVHIVSIIGIKKKTGKFYVKDKNEMPIEIDSKFTSFVVISKMKLEMISEEGSFVRSKRYERDDLHVKTDKNAFEISGIHFSGRIFYCFF